MYATRADMEALYGADDVALWATRSREDGPSETSIEGALNDSAGFIDTHLASRYKLPLRAPAPVLQRPCIDIAVYYLANTASRATEDIRQRYEDAVSLLKRLANGTATLGLDTDGDGAAESASRVISVSGPERQMTRETLREL
ncbi:MAG: phage protein Gp36 family protein [Pseudomonadota bacterium]